MSAYSFSCPGGVIGALFRDVIAKGEATPEMIARNDKEIKEWEEAGIEPGQMATYLADGRLVAENSPEALAEFQNMLSSFVPLSEPK